MGFLSPITALIAAGITVPLLVSLYFLKLRRRQVMISSTLLWKKAIQDMQVNSPFQRLRRSLLLLLQLLILGAMLFAMARPTMQTTASPGQRVVIVIDHSAVALLASGIDVDGDGIVGRDRSQADWIFRVPTAPQFWTTDSGDTVRALQLRVARTLVERLVLRQNRVGLASFAVRSRYKVDVLPLLTDVSQVLVPVGATGAVLAALNHFPPAHAQKRTDLSRLLEQAALLLDEAVTHFEPVRPRALLLLYLGQPSAPDGKYWSSQRALERAAELGKRGIAVWGIPIGPGKFDFLDELTRRSGGGVIPLDQLDARFAPIVPGESGANVHNIRG